MSSKRLSLRFNLNNPGDLAAWEYLHRLDGDSIKTKFACRFCFFLTPLDKGDNIGYNIEDNSEVQYET